MLIFLDTEFTDFARPDLISLALVSEDGREFYAERTDYRKDDCSDFVRETVLPLLGRVLGAACSRPELTRRVRQWFEALPEPATIILTMSGTGYYWPMHILVTTARNHQPTWAERCTWIDFPLLTRSLSRRKTTPTPETGPHTMPWPMRGR